MPKPGRQLHADNVRVVIFGLIFIVSIIVVGSFWLIHDAKEVPSPIWGLAGTALGSLGTLLTFTFTGVVPERRHMSVTPVISPEIDQELD